MLSDNNSTSGVGGLWLSVNTTKISHNCHIDVNSDTVTGTE